MQFSAILSLRSVAAPIHLNKHKNETQHLETMVSMKARMQSTGTELQARARKSSTRVPMPTKHPSARSHSRKSEMVATLYLSGLLDLPLTIEDTSNT
jgi:hypothetical protein